MVTGDAAAILRMQDGRGEIRQGGVADFVVVRDGGRSPAATLLDLREIEMSVVRGRIRLVSERFQQFAGPRFEWLTVAGRGRKMVDARVGELYQEAVARLGTVVRLAGRRVRIRWNK
jgi:cytosine/adenosine deaminase-related metal-dependent hydrolase